MQCEDHRKMAVKAFARYETGELDQLERVKSIHLSSLPSNKLIDRCKFQRCIYVLRLSDKGKRLDHSIASITPASETKCILYIGGHKPGNQPKYRFNDLLKDIRAAQQFYENNGYASNDKKDGGHPVAGMLTTNLLSLGFRVDKHCILDIIDGDNDVDELDLIIGYQERYHHLPPWNASRKGSSAFA